MHATLLVRTSVFIAIKKIQIVKETWWSDVMKGDQYLTSIIDSKFYILFLNSIDILKKFWMYVHLQFCHCWTFAGLLVFCLYIVLGFCNISSGVYLPDIAKWNTKYTKLLCFPLDCNNQINVVLSIKVIINSVHRIHLEASQESYNNLIQVEWNRSHVK